MPPLAGLVVANHLEQPRQDGLVIETTKVTYV